MCICYEYHNNVFLLRFCTVLSKYEPECLRFINNYNSTTSLYDRFNNKLLVTFRNENMVSYGQGWGGVRQATNMGLGRQLGL